MSSEYWLFGYGSLIWRPPPHTVERVPGYINGFVRRFWQSSNDHRGTPDFPGRVVTLITKEYWQSLNDPHPYGADEVVWGVAYRIDPAYAKEVKEYMDYREKNGYTEMTMEFHPGANSAREASWLATVYVGTPDNEAFVGPQDPKELAQLISQRHGPSGPNYEYLLNLERDLNELHPDAGDRHISDLAERVRALIAVPN